MFIGAGSEGFDPTLGVSLGTFAALDGPRASSWDELSVTLRWRGSGGRGMAVPLVRGSPYITAEYEGTVPKFASMQALRMSGPPPPIIVVDGKQVKYTITYYTIVYYTIVYYNMLYYTILYYTILCYTMLYYTNTILILY